MASLPSSASPPFMIMISLIMLLLLISWSEAREYLVGGSESSWKLPLPSPDSLNQWANTHQFLIGDALIFKYDNKIESVHVVNETDYTMCNTVGQHMVFKDGNSKVLLTSSEPIHIISGDKDHCLMGLKLAVVVSGKDHGEGKSSHSPAPSPLPLSSPSPSPSTSHGVVGRGFIGALKTSLGVLLVSVMVSPLNGLSF